MGLFNAYSCINRINNLIKDLENQLAVTSSHLENNVDRWTLNNDLNAHKTIHNQLLDAFESSSAARVSVYKWFGREVRMNDILLVSKEIIYELNAHIK